MAGGSGAEWIFAYDTWPRIPAKHLDIACENWRPWDALWDHTAIALDFFQKHLPFAEMNTDDKSLTTTNGWCFSKPGELYAVYLFADSDAKLRLPAGEFSVKWLNPWNGGDLMPGKDATGPGPVGLTPPSDNTGRDWVALVKRKR
jgi:hypothetical protein